MFFNLHHHSTDIKNGIYNLNSDEFSSENYFSIGIHPKDIGVNYEKQLDLVEKNCLQKKCLAIGECGLDGLISVPQNLQEIVFKRQIEIAEKNNLPIIIHCVKKYYEVASLCRKTNVPVIFHGFNKKKNIADMLLSKGFYLSFGSALINNLTLQKTFEETPLNSIFLETDSSDINIKEIYEKAAEIKKISIDELQKHINQLLLQIFKIKENAKLA